MSILNMFGGDLGPDKIKDILTDGEKIKQFLPIIIQIAETFKNEDEHSIIASIGIEDEKPILRVMTTKVVVINGEKKLILNRNVDGPDGALKFDLLQLLATHKPNEQ